MKKSGFGLIETFISSALLLFLIAGTAQLLTISLAARRSADFCLAAARRAGARLERFKSLGFDSAELGPGTTDSIIKDPALLRDLAESCAIEDLDPSLKRVTLRVSDAVSPHRRQVFCVLLCRELEF